MAELWLKTEHSVNICKNFTVARMTLALIMILNNFWVISCLHFLLDIASLRRAHGTLCVLHFMK